MTRRRLRYLQEGGWLDYQSLDVTITVLLLNLETRTLTMMRLFFVFPREGGLAVMQRMQTVDSDDGVSWWTFLCASVWLLLLCAIVFTELQEVSGGLRRWADGDAAGIQDYLSDKWNVLDWATAVLGLTHQRH